VGFISGKIGRKPARPHAGAYDQCCGELREFTYTFKGSFEFRGWWIFKRIVIKEFHM